MSLDYDALMNWPFDDVEQTYTEKDTILYALSLGFGKHPCDPEHLNYVYEKGLHSFPTMAVIMGSPPRGWLTDPKTGIDFVKVLHGEQHLEIHKKMPPSTTIIGQTKVLDIIDKGKEKGALLFTQRKIYEKSSGDLLNTQKSVIFARGNGGFQRPPQTSPPPPQAIPNRAPDLHQDLYVEPQSALLYRLNGDYNPLHADPGIANKAGFDQPILHGLATYGVAARAIMQSASDQSAKDLQSFNARFSAPVFPGETLRTEIWYNADMMIFRTLAMERNRVVLNNGSARIG